ncbi:MAG: hypothetical protein FH762_02595 [Firmicutes bacterium]|nr:hypothetical protein [Bacillota bacterium]
MSVKTYFIAGFLGAGKTTLLNNLLRELSDKRTAVIMNEFGQVNIDLELIEYKEGMELSEINNGSIFCTCLSGSFVKRIVELAKLPLDYLLVESSGMARPASIGTILDQVDQLADKSIDYQGMITIVDATTYLKLVKSVNAVQEQVIYSDLVIINKIDLVDESLISEIEKSILLLNPGVEIVKTKFARVDNIFEQGYYVSEYKERQPLEECGRDKGMFKTLLKTKKRISEKSLLKFIEALLTQTFRIKGLVKTEGGLVHVDCAGEQLKIDRLEGNDPGPDNSQLIFISNEKEIKKLVEKGWQDNVAVEYKII